MKMYIKQKVFTLGDKFYIYDESGQRCYYVEGKFLSLHKKLRLYSLSGEELCCIRRQIFSILPSYILKIGDGEEIEVTREFTLFKPKYTVEGTDWNVTGNFWAHEYQIENYEGVIASLSKHWFTFGDSYELEINDDENIYLALSVLLIIDAEQESESRQH